MGRSAAAAVKSFGLSEMLGRFHLLNHRVGVRLRNLQASQMACRAAPRRTTSNLNDDPNFDHLIRRQLKVRAGPLGYLFQEDEEAFTPECHAW